MASLPHNAEASHLISSGLPSFEGSLVNGEYHYQQTPLTCPSFPPTDFEDHFQEIHGQGSWRAPAIHHEQPSRLSSSSPFERLAVENCSAPMFSRYGDSHQSFSDMAGSWNGKLSHLLACANGMDGNPMSPLPPRYLSEGASLAEVMTTASSNVAAKGDASLLNGFPHPSPLIGKHFSYNLGINSPNVGLTVDPSKGGLAIQDVNLLAGQSSLFNLPIDPMFMDKTAKFAFFNKQASLLSSTAAELSQDAANQLMRDGGNSASQPMLPRVPSGFGTPSSSTSNSPSGREVLQQSAVKNRQEILNSVATAKGDPQTNAYSNMVIFEEPKYVSSKKPSLLPTLVEIDGSEGMAKQCTSIDESDESMGLDITSSCERDNGWESTIHNTSTRKKRTKDRSKHSVVRLSDVKDHAGEEVKDKRHKGGDDVIEDDLNKKVEQSNDSDESMHMSIKESSKPPEAPKPDYIHVRARRGQATDSHSLAERIRREKISERMKFLQDLVPGCSKITGKAVMLDEIINYVQSLQRQVEFLSMKLAAVNPRVEFNMDNLFRRDIFQPHAPTHQSLMFSAENPHSYKPMQHQQSQAPSRMGGHGGVSHPPIDIHSLGKPDPSLRTTVSTPIASKEAYGDIISQASQAWDDELQNVVQMSFAQGRQTPLTSPILQGQQPFSGQMKPEI